jgi:predicted amidohydrolase
MAITGEKPQLLTGGDRGRAAGAELPFGNVAVMICYDLEFPEWVRVAALAGADLIAVPVNWTRPAGPCRLARAGWRAVRSGRLRAGSACGSQRRVHRGRGPVRY